jgi:predicted negative regulator of RcsB-dependent stress response
MEYLITVVVLVYGAIAGWFFYQLQQQKILKRS